MNFEDDRSEQAAGKASGGESVCFDDDRSEVASQVDGQLADTAELSEPVGERFPGRFRRQPEVPEHVWKRFSLEVVDETRCLARVYLRGGFGGQCNFRPAGDERCCRLHSNPTRQVYGLVTGPTPQAKRIGRAGAPSQNLAVSWAALQHAPGVPRARSSARATAT